MSQDNIQLTVKKSDVSSVNRGGRPTKYEAETVDRILAAIADGLTLRQASIVGGINEDTLSDWRERYPDLQEQLAAAREQARQKALAGIKAAGYGGDWRALEAFLKFSFWQDYRQNPSVQVNATAVAQTTEQVSDEAMRARLIKLREKRLQIEAGREHLALDEPNESPQSNVGVPNANSSGNDAAPESRPGSPWTIPAGAKAPIGASPAFRAWLEHEGPEPEPGA
jgi:hypothetical protein